jgi:hypothetical protein
MNDELIDELDLADSVDEDEAADVVAGIIVDQRDSGRGNG